MARTIVLEPAGGGAPFACDEPELRVGRGIRAVRDEDPGTGLLEIDDAHAGVSREHARLRWEQGALVVENLGKHGTFVNGRPVEGRRALADGDEIQFGKGGPRYVVRIRAEAPDAERRRCRGCRRILAAEEVEAHERACEGLAAKPRRTAPPAFAFGTLRSAKRNLLLLLDLSGGPDGAGTELGLVADGLVEALRGTPEAGPLRFNVLAFGGAAGVEPWRPDGLHPATEEARADARAWIRARAPARPGGATPVLDALSRAFEAKGADALVLVVAGDLGAAEARIAALEAGRGVEIHAVGLGARYAGDARAQASLRKLAARHGGGFLSVVAGG